MMPTVFYWTQEKLFPLYGGSTLNKNKYDIKLYARAYRDLDGIYTYIAENLLEPDTALNMVDELEKAIFSLEQKPERGAIRRVGTYANGNYRQLFVKNYCIIYRVLKGKKEVHIVTVRYAPSNF
jgi:plasmid stabilization system protein ParE